jgi:hypothetical protein
MSLHRTQKPECLVVTRPDGTVAAVGLKMVAAIAAASASETQDRMRDLPRMRANEKRGQKAFVTKSGGYSCLRKQLRPDHPKGLSFPV